VRAEFDANNDTMGKKIRNGAKAKIPVLLILGEKEESAGTVTVRRYGKEEQLTLPYEEFRATLLDDIRTRKLDAARML
jgi:threonyl-tRNA synthetase